MNHLERAKDWMYMIGDKPKSEEDRLIKFSMMHALIAIAEQLERANYLKSMELYAKDVIGFVVFDKFDLSYEEDKETKTKLCEICNKATAGDSTFCDDCIPF